MDHMGPSRLAGAACNIVHGRRASNGSRSLKNAPTRNASARDWAQVLARYREPNLARSTFELLITAAAFVALWFLTWAALGLGYWLSLLIAVPAAGFLVRLFMIQHDCGHGSFFRHRATNDWVGRAIGAVTLTPYDVWRSSHAVHHASSGNLERRGIGDITTLTVQEYLALSRWRRLGYRLYRNPIVMFVAGPGLSVHLAAPPADRGAAGRLAGLAQHHGHQRGDRAHHRRLDVAGRRPAVPARALADRAARRLDRRVAVLCPAPIRGHVLGRESPAGPCTRRHFTAARTTTCRASCGGSRPTSACTTCTIFAAASPTTGCRRCCATTRSSKGIGRLTLLQSFSCVRLVLWDESRRRLISFRELAERRRRGTAPRA